MQLHGCAFNFYNVILAQPLKENVEFHLTSIVRCTIASAMSHAGRKK